MRIAIINTPDEMKPVNRDMAGGLGFDRGQQTLLPPLDLLCYATVLRSKGHDVYFVDGQLPDASETIILAQLSAFQPEAVITAISLPLMDEDIAFSHRLRAVVGPACLVAFKTGVRYPELIERMLRESAVNFCILGECDLEIEDVLTGVSTQGTARLVDGAIKNVPDILRHDLTDLPILDRSLLDPAAYRYPGLPAPMTTLQSSRGCPFSCGYYCPYPLVQGKQWRAMKAERVADELASIAAAGYASVLFRDATFTLNKKRAGDICKLIIARGIKLSWWCETRIDCLTPELLKLMHQAGCVGFNVGVETGDDGLMQSIAKAGVTLADVAEMRRLCGELGIEIRFLLLLGLPGENKETLLSTFMLVRNMNPDHIGVTTATPYPGTAFFTDAVANNWIKNSDVNSYGGHGFDVEVPPLSAADLGFVMERIHAVHKAGRRSSPDAADVPRRLEQEMRTWAQA